MRTYCCLLIALSICFTSFSQTISGNTTFCQGSSTVLSVSGTTGPTTYQWQSSPDGSTWTNAGTNPTLTVTAAGMYQVFLNGSSTATGSVTVTVNPKPSVDFSPDADNVCSGTPIQFTSNVSGNGPFTYSWDFGDGGTSTAQNPAHTFNAVGCGIASFNVKLTVTDANGCSNTVTKVSTIKRIPDIDIKDQDGAHQFNNCYKNPSAANPNYTLTILNNSASSACINTYNIDWGDGSVQSNISFPATHTYTQLGAFNLVITAIGANGCSNSKTQLVANQSNPAGGLGTLGSTTNLCAPSTIPFVISNWQSNSPGTTYQLSFGDGTSITLNHPLNATGTPETINHTYVTSSCPSSPTYTATLTVINACDRTPYTAGNIQIRTKPIASFTSANSVCINRSICFNNTTTVGSQGNNCSPFENDVWDFGDGSPTSNSSCHTYTAVGTYTVTLTTSNDCGSSSFSKTICVTGTTNAVFTLDNAAGCSPLPVNMANNSTGSSSCTTPTYLWSMGYLGNNCGSALPTFNYLNGTSLSSANLSLSLISPGTYTFTLTATNACGSASVTKTVVVKRSPTPKINTIPTQCGTGSITPSAVVDNCGGATPATYMWSFPGGNPSSSSNLNPGPVSFSGFGTNTIQLTATNECGAITYPQTFSINPPTDLTVQNLTFCAGQPTGNIALISTTSGAVITWTRSGSSIGLTPTNGTGNISSFTTTNAGTNPLIATITVTASAVGCITTKIFTITVNPIPAAPGVITPRQYCIGSVASPLTATATGNNTLNWYTVPIGGTSTSTAPIPNTASVGSTVYYVSQTNQYGCEGPRASIVVTVNPIPTFTATPNNPSSCVLNDGTIFISGLLNSTTYTVSYSLNGTPVPAFNKTSSNSGTFTISGLGPGTYNNITVTLNSCTSNAAGPFTLTVPNPPVAPSASSNGPICSGSTLNLAATVTVTGASYSWTGPNGFTSLAQNPSIANASIAANGTYFVTVKVNGCTSSATPVPVVINPTPSQLTIGSNSPLCSGNNLNLSATATGTGTITYAWTGPNGFSSTLQNPVITNAGTNASGGYAVIATAEQGNCSATATKSITVNPTPNIAVTGTNPTSCTIANGMLSISGLIANSSYTVQYSKNGNPSTITSLSSAIGVINISNLTAGVYSNISVIYANCPSNVAGPITLSNPNAPLAPNVGSNSPLCSGNSLLLTANTTAGVTYSWTGPGGYTSAQQNPVITNAGASASGTYTLVVSLNGCTSPPASVNVVVNPTPVVPTVSSNSPLCSGNTLTLTASSTSRGGITYSWIGPNNFLSNLQNPVVASISAADAGVYTVTAFAGTCASALTSTIVIVNPMPNIVTVTYQSPSACSTASGAILLSGLQPSTIYIVQYSKNGFAPTVIQTRSNAQGIITISNLAAGTYANISVNLNGCTSNIVGPIDLQETNAAPTPTAFGNGPICEGKDIQLSATSIVPGAAFQWSGPNGFTSTSQTPTISNATLLSSGIYYVTISINGCSSAAAAVTVTVNRIPIVNAGPDFNVCRGQSLQLNVSGAQTYQWSPVNGLSCNNCPNPVASPLSTTKYIVAGVSSGCTAYDTVLITVAQPFKISVSNSDSICIGSSVSLSATGAPQYLWSPGNGLSCTNCANPVASPSSTTAYTVIGFDQYNCFTDTGRVTIGVGTYPTVNLGPDLILSTGTLQPLNSMVTNGPISKWLWSPATDLSCNNCSLPVATVKKDISYSVVVSNSYGCSASDTINIKVTCDQTQIFIPNAFTPDGDGINDILMVRGKGIAMVKYFRIFNRWGELIFEKSNFQPNDPAYAWDGKIKGVVGPPDVFVYTAEVVCENGSSFIYKGNVSILK